jgi:integration host factor subunit alpha
MIIMAGDTVTRADLADAVYEVVGLSRVESSDLVDAFVDEMANAIVNEGVLKISSFGTFSVRQKKARVGRNPKTGIEVTITPRKVVTYKASHVLKERMNDE